MGTDSFTCHLFFEILRQPWLSVRPNKSSIVNCRCWVLLPCSCSRDPTTVIMGSPGLLRAARNRLIAVETRKEEVQVQSLLKELRDTDAVAELKRGKNTE